jgi:hypothetical protein
MVILETSIRCNIFLFPWLGGQKISLLPLLPFLLFAISRTYLSGFSSLYTMNMSEATDKEKRFDDYSQDENVERHVRKNRWVSIDLGGKPYVFLFATSPNQMLFFSFRLNLSVTLGSVAYQNCFIAFIIHSRASLSVLKLVLKSV